MKLYRNAVGTWQVPGQQDKKAERVEVPTTSAELAAFLNDLCGSDELVSADSSLAAAVVEVPIERPVMAVDKPVYQHSHNTRALSETSFTADEIQQFILDHATVAQVENIFACLGTRFAEQRRAA